MILSLENMHEKLLGFGCMHEKNKFVFLEIGN